MVYNLFAPLHTAYIIMMFMQWNTKAAARIHTHTSNLNDLDLLVFCMFFFRHTDFIALQFFFVFFFHFIFNVFCFLSICFVGYCFCLDSFSLNFCEYEFPLRWSCSFLLQICTRTWIDLSHWSQRARHHGRRSKLMYIGHENESIFKSIRLFNLLLLIVVTYGKTCEYARVLPQGYLQEPNCLWIDGWIKIHITDSL